MNSDTTPGTELAGRRGPSSRLKAECLRRRRTGQDWAELGRVVQGGGLDVFLYERSQFRVKLLESIRWRVTRRPLRRWRGCRGAKIILSKNVGACLAGSGGYRGWPCKRAISSRLYDSTGWGGVRVLEGGGGLHRVENAREGYF